MKALLLAVISAASLAGQYYPRHNFTLGVGGASPRGALRDLFRTRPAIAVSYGYRFLPYLQAEAGLDTVFGAGGVRDFLETSFGPIRIRDFQFLVPFGGRAILPVFRGRLLLFGGGGGAYLRYTELLRQPSSYFRIDCPVCGSRSGWGYYALSGFNGFLDRGRHFRSGITVKVYRGHTEGDPLGFVPGVRTRDRWLQIFGELGFSF